MTRRLLCLVTDRSAARDDLVECVFAAVRAGVDRIQIRERGLDGAALLDHSAALADAARRGAAEREGRVEIIVNRRVDIALAVAADGVHLGFDAMSPSDARAAMGDRARIGISVHAPEEIEAAAAEVDYAHLAPIFDPLSKAATRPPLGCESIARAANPRLSVIAQGGITAANAADVVAAGAAGIAVTGAILSSADPAKATELLRSALDA